jgi:hypothetical protein
MLAGGFTWSVNQGCQMVSFQTENPNLGIFWRALDWKNCYILRPFGIFYRHFGNLWPFGTFCIHLVHFSPFWYHLPRKIWQPCCKRDGIGLTGVELWCRLLAALPTLSKGNPNRADQPVDQIMNGYCAAMSTSKLPTVEMSTKWPKMSTSFDPGDNPSGVRCPRRG